MKKPQKSKARKGAKRSRPANAPAALVVHSSRRQPAAPRKDYRLARPKPRPEPATVYRRSSPLTIGSTADKRAFRLLLLPFVALAVLLAVIPALHVYPTLRDLILATPQVAVAPVRTVTELVAAPMPSVRLASAHSERMTAVTPPALTREAVAQASTAVAVTGGPLAVAEKLPAETLLKLARLPAPVPARAKQMPAGGSRRVEAGVISPAPIKTVSLETVEPVAASPAVDRVAELSASAPAFTPATGLERQVAMLRQPEAPRLLSPLPPPSGDNACPVAYGSAAPSDDDTMRVAEPSAPFGQRLALSAAAQTQHFVIYDDKYRPISRAGGDVPSLYGVCTDVVVRAYRSVGIDLQVLVQSARVGAGDPNIDHRRTETLRRYFARFGQDLPITPFGENYQPGDVVTYWRPQNSGSRSHIAVVAAQRGPSGNPMIIHNRGWGPQLEDALFVDRITGHYRYDGANRPAVPPELAANRARPFPLANATSPAAARSGSAAHTGPSSAF